MGGPRGLESSFRLTVDFRRRGRISQIVYRARDAVENEEWLEAIEAAGLKLDLHEEAISTAEDLFLSTVPEAERSKRASAAASLYAASLVTGDERSQRSVAQAMGVSRLSVQGRWKDVVEVAGFDPPTW